MFVVRQPIAAREISRRRLEERLALRFRGALPVLVRAILRLPPRSRVRRALLRHAMEVGVAALNRGDFEAGFVALGDECESSFPAQMGGLGSEAGTHGREERVRFHTRFTDEWGELRYEVSELIDLGDRRILGIGRMKGTGLGSGAAFDNQWAFLLTFAGGEVVREQVFLDHGEALRAAGLRE